MALKDGKMADGKWILVGEPTGMRLGIAQKGCLWLEISAKGFTSHGAYPKEGANAVSCAVRIADQVKAFVEQTDASAAGLLHRADHDDRRRSRQQYDAGSSAGW